LINRLKVVILISNLLLVQAAFSAEYIGNESCVSCHEKEVSLWQGSHHDLAMQHVDDKTVLGDFSNVEFRYAGITSKFYKKNNRFMVRTDGPDGKMHDYEIKYVFGVAPLQQYLIELDKGRLQALSIAWDSRPKAEDGQRWFHLYPDEAITHKDALHWTRPSFNWNGMCAECHSTDLQKNYDAGTDSFQTTWSEIDVSCEACHGPASGHIDWAKRKKSERTDDNKGFSFVFDERKDVHWNMDADTGSALRSKARESDKEIEVCAQCHSRRSAISDDYVPGKPFNDHYVARLLDQDMYFPDGQIQDEVYVYGSFLQSKMYHKGVTCSDCHEPHSLKLRQEDNGVCLQCHEADKFDTSKHHFHDEGSTGAQCTECHMPARDYMVVDPRRDHSIRIPRPDLSVKLKIPNACNQCHQDKDDAWSAVQIKKWYEKPLLGYQEYADAIDAGRTSREYAGNFLEEQIRSIDAPVIARASAITLLPPYLDESNINLLQQGLNDENVMVRRASVSALEGLPHVLVAQLAFPSLDDPARSVRLEAARVLAPINPGQLQDEQLNIYNNATQEYIDSQSNNAERPEAQLNLGNYYTASGKLDKATSSYMQAIELDDTFIPAYINLADLYRAREKDDEAEKILQDAIKIAPEDAAVNYSLGLLMVRKKQGDSSIKYLKRAAGIEAGNARYIYVYAVALNSVGQSELAIDVLQDATTRFPRDVNILEALIAFHRDAGNDFAAKTYMNKLEKLR
jgi:tetratricopeptide (TPR) repeat protein